MKKQIPTHIAIIMDGNRRWAKQRRLNASEGHKAGVEALESTVKAAGEAGIKYLTVYALSTENLKERSKLEIALLFSLIKKGLKEKLPMLDKNEVKIKFLGDIENLHYDVRKDLEEFEEKLSKNNKLYLNICLNYGGKDEIVHSVNMIGNQSKKISSGDIAKNLYTAGIPDPDLLIRTGGHKRLSNFLLWQISYSELYFTNILWPDFGKKELQKALKDYEERKRNFGS